MNPESTAAVLIFAIMAIGLFIAARRSDKAHLELTESVREKLSEISDVKVKIEHAFRLINKLEESDKSSVNRCNTLDYNWSVMNKNIQFNAEAQTKFVKNLETDFELFKQKIKNMEPVGPMQLELILSAKPEEKPTKTKLKAVAKQLKDF